MKFVSRGACLAFIACGIPGFAAQTLADTLRAASVATGLFSETELAEKITSYASSGGNPFLLAWYTDDGSGFLRLPLHVIRYDRDAGDLRRGDLRDGDPGIGALSQTRFPLDCVGSAIQIHEHGDTIYIDTHINPSAGCVIALSSSTMAFKAPLPGWLLGFIGSDRAILQGNEIHFMSVHPLHIEIFDVKRNRSVQVYPYKDDPERRKFSHLIEPHISQKWCMEANAQCDPANFDTTLEGEVIVNEAAGVFGFLAKFDANGFGDAAGREVAPRTVAYVFRERGGNWDHQEFAGSQLRRLLSGTTFVQLIRRNPDLPFQASRAK